MCNDADQYVRVADRIVPTGTSLPPFARFGSKADKPSQAKIQICPLLSESGQDFSPPASKASWSSSATEEYFD
jgi:hypothetical protein